MDPATLWASIWSVLQQYGLAGVVIGILFYLCRTCFLESVEQNKARIVDLKEIWKITEDSSKILAETLQTTRERNAVIDSFARAIEANSKALEVLRLEITARKEREEVEWKRLNDSINRTGR